MQYQMIALDLDGTFLTRKGRPSKENLAAVARAQDAGVLVVPCTGRAWRESTHALDGFPSPDIGVFVTGAAITHITSGNTLDLAVIEPDLALGLVELLYDQPEAVLVFRDRNVTGHDYLITGTGTLTPNTQWWFQVNGADVHFQRNVTRDDLHHTLRVGLVAPGSRVGAICDMVARHFGDQVLVHAFAAVQQPDPDDTIYVLEAFARGVDKWRGLTWIANDRGIDPARIAVIGDEVNDVQMLASAQCGIAMGNAVDQAKSVANHITRDCDEHGVAYAIDQLMSGAWG